MDASQLLVAVASGNTENEMAGLWTDPEIRHVPANTHRYKHCVSTARQKELK